MVEFILSNDDNCDTDFNIDVVVESIELDNTSLPKMSTNASKFLNSHTTSFPYLFCFN